MQVHSHVCTRLLMKKGRRGKHRHSRSAFASSSSRSKVCKFVYMHVHMCFYVLYIYVSCTRCVYACVSKYLLDASFDEQSRVGRHRHSRSAFASSSSRPERTPSNFQRRHSDPKRRHSAPDSQRHFRMQSNPEIFRGSAFPENSLALQAQARQNATHFTPERHYQFVHQSYPPPPNSPIRNEYTYPDASNIQSSPGGPPLRNEYTYPASDSPTSSGVAISVRNEYTYPASDSPTSSGVAPPVRAQYVYRDTSDSPTSSGTGSPVRTQHVYRDVSNSPTSSGPGSPIRTEYTANDSPTSPGVDRTFIAMYNPNEDGRRVETTEINEHISSGDDAPPATPPAANTSFKSDYSPKSKDRIHGTTTTKQYTRALANKFLDMEQRWVCVACFFCVSSVHVFYTRGTPRNLHAQTDRCTSQLC